MNGETEVLVAGIVENQPGNDDRKTNNNAAMSEEEREIQLAIMASLSETPNSNYNCSTSGDSSSRKRIKWITGDEDEVGGDDVFDDDHDPDDDEDVVVGLDDVFVSSSSHAQQVQNTRKMESDQILEMFGSEKFRAIDEFRKMWMLNLRRELEPRVSSFISIILKASQSGYIEYNAGYDVDNFPLAKPSESKDKKEDPLFSHYESLHCEMMPLEVDSEEFSMIEKYVQNTSYHTVHIVHIFRVSREGEAARFKKFSNVKNRMLLWHGSPLANWTGILSKGLLNRGNGIYFADMFAKSATYCRVGTGAGALLLCEVALGDMLTANYRANNLPEGKLSTKIVGSTAPDSSEVQILEDGGVVPLGKVKQQQGSQGGFIHNEYIVQNEDQIKMRYVVHVNFVRDLVHFTSRAARTVPPAPTSIVRTVLPVSTPIVTPLRRKQRNSK